MASMHRFSLCLWRKVCGECASCAGKVVGVAFSFETFGVGYDVGHHANGCGAAQPASLDGRRVRTVRSERPNTAAKQARQVSLLL